MGHLGSIQAMVPGILELGRLPSQLAGLILTQQSGCGHSPTPTRSGKIGRHCWHNPSVRPMPRTGSAAGPLLPLTGISAMTLRGAHDVAFAANHM
jgi:hypothetical protein